MKWNIDFITRENYKKHVKEFYEQVLNCTTASNLEVFNRNIIDPIKMTFSYFATGEDKESIISSEISRQQDKTVNNSIGYFHQKIFSYITDWETPATGFDIVNKKKHIFAEIKNKHNTMNSSSSQRTYINMQSKILDDDKAVCYLVEVIARTSQDVPWTISINGNQKNHSKIRRISLDRFYEIVTGERESFKKIVEWLPITLKEIVVEGNIHEPENKIIEELEKNSSFFNNLYLLAFKDYYGFNKLKFVSIDKLGDDFKSKNEE